MRVRNRKVAGKCRVTDNALEFSVKRLPIECEASAVCVEAFDPALRLDAHDLFIRSRFRRRKECHRSTCLTVQPTPTKHEYAVKALEISSSCVAAMAESARPSAHHEMRCQLLLF